MRPPRHGLAPVVATIILVLLVVVAGGGMYVWISTTIGEQQDEADQALATRTAVRDAVCRNDQVRVTLSNTGEAELDGSDVSMYLFEAGDLVDAVERNISTAAVTAPGGVSTLTFNLSTVLAASHRYSVEIEFTGSGYTATTTCTADAGFPAGYQYARNITVSNTHSGDLDGFPATVTIDTATLIGNGKMQNDCDDIRLYDGGEQIRYNVTDCNTATTDIHFATDIAASTSETDVYLYYGNPGAGDGQQRVRSRIINGDFTDGWAGWSKAPDTSGGTNEFWIDEFPDDGTCTGPQTGASDNPCSYPAANVTIRSTATGNALCSARSGCPTPVIGDGNLNLDGSSSGSGYNGNIRSDSYRVPGDVHLHWWHNLQGRSSDGGRYDGSTRWYGTANATPSTEGEGMAWAVVVDEDADNDIDGDDWLARSNVTGGDNWGNTQDLTEEKTIDVAGRSGTFLRVYIANNHGGGGDDGLIQVDDLYWSDSAGNEITLSTAVGQETAR